MFYTIKNLFTGMKAKAKAEKGQAMVEYGLLIGLIAVAVIAVLLIFGPQIAAMFQKANDALPVGP